MDSDLDEDNGGVDFVIKEDYSEKKTIDVGLPCKKKKLSNLLEMMTYAWPWTRTTANIPYMELSKLWTEHT